jgi:hypothetical protein
MEGDTLKTSSLWPPEVGSKVTWKLTRTVSILEEDKAQSDDSHGLSYTSQSQIHVCHDWHSSSLPLHIRRAANKFFALANTRCTYIDTQTYLALCPQDSNRCQASCNRVWTLSGPSATPGLVSCMGRYIYFCLIASTCYFGVLCLFQRTFCLVKQSISNSNK